MTNRKKDRAKYIDRMNGNRKTALSGLRFGKLIAVKIAERYMEKVYWLCKCDCGTELVAVASDLKKGKVTACRLCTRKAARLES